MVNARAPPVTVRAEATRDYVAQPLLLANVELTDILTRYPLDTNPRSGAPPLVPCRCRRWRARQ